MPTPTRAQLVLVELAAAGALVGYANDPPWRFVGYAAAAVLAVLALVPVGRWWLYQGLLARVRLLRRRRAGLTGVAAAVGPFDVVALRGSGKAAGAAAVRSGTTWTVALDLPLTDVFNDDRPVPVHALAALLTVDDAPLASVRLLTRVTPSPVGTGLHAQRLLVLTLDTVQCVDALAARGGTEQAVHQVLRRCVLRAQDTLASVGVPSRVLDEAGTGALFASWLGPAGGGASGESWRAVDLGGVRSRTVAVTGPPARVLDALGTLAAGVRAPLAATAVVVARGRRAAVNCTLLLRLSAPSSADAAVSRDLAAAARRLGLTVRPLPGEQGDLLAATLPLGVVFA